MEIDDPFDNLEIPVLRDFYIYGWQNWIGIIYENKNQLELFDTTDYQTKDRFGRPFSKTQSGYIERTI
jgi:hypothetical protein